MANKKGGSKPPTPTQIKTKQIIDSGKNAKHKDEDWKGFVNRERASKKDSFVNHKNKDWVKHEEKRRGFEQQNSPPSKTNLNNKVKQAKKESPQQEKAKEIQKTKEHEIDKDKE